jgi:hypothetical protein
MVRLQIPQAFRVRPRRVITRDEVDNFGGVFAFAVSSSLGSLCPWGIRSLPASCFANATSTIHLILSFPWALCIHSHRLSLLRLANGLILGLSVFIAICSLFYALLTGYNKIPLIKHHVPKKLLLRRCPSPCVLGRCPEPGHMGRDSSRPAPVRVASTNHLPSRPHHSPKPHHPPLTLRLCAKTSQLQKV